MNNRQNDFFPESSDEEIQAEIKLDEELLWGKPLEELDYIPDVEAEESEEQGASEYMEEIQRDYEKRCKTLSHRRLKRVFEKRVNDEKDLAGDFDGTLTLNRVRHDDYLDRMRSAKTYSSYIKNNRIRNNIAVIGGWGTGKSTFLEFIKNDLKRDNNVFLIEYDAASYEHEEQIWGNLYKLILESYNRNTNMSQFRYKIKKFKDRFSSGGLEKLLTLVVRVLILLFLAKYVIGKEFLKTNDVNLKELAMGLIAYAAVILDALSLLLSLTEKVVTRISCITNRITTTYKSFDCAELLGTRERVANEIKIIMSAWFDFWPVKKQEGKLVILVDELDRCSDVGIQNFFKSVHLLLDNERISFIYAMDDSRLKKAFSFETDDETRKYIEKYAQLTYCTDYNDSYNVLIKHACEETCLSEIEVNKIIECVKAIRSNISARTIVTIVSNLVLIKNKFSSIYYPKEDCTVLFTEFIAFYFLIYAEKNKTIRALSDAWNEADKKGIEYYCSLYDAFAMLEDCDAKYLEKYETLTKQVIFGNASEYSKTVVEYPIQ